jgi:L-lactate dehydrogenase complex protein LldF
VCPVRIDIPRVLVELRAQVVDAHRGGRPAPEGVAMRAAGWTFGSARRLRAAERLTGPALSAAARVGAAAWTRARDLPPRPPESFRAWWRRTGGDR